MHEGLQQVCRWVLALLTGYVTMAFLLTALHTAALPREFIGFRPERKNLFDMVAPDRQWLGFTQYVSENVFQQGGVVPRIFDGTVAKIPGQDNDIWPSFPIRYATRRESLTTSSRSTKGGRGIKRSKSKKESRSTSGESF